MAFPAVIFMSLMSHGCVGYSCFGAFSSVFRATSSSRIPAVARVRRHLSLAVARAVIGLIRCIRAAGSYRLDAGPHLLEDRDSHGRRRVIKAERDVRRCTMPRAFSWDVYPYIESVNF